MAGVIGAYVAGLAGMAVVEARPGLDSPAWSLAVVAGWSVALGWLVAARCPRSPVSVGLVLLGAAPTLVSAIEEWAASWQSEAALPAADLVARCTQGVWVFNLAGFVVLAAAFPSGSLPGRRWAVLPWVFVGVAVAAGVVLAAQPDQYVGAGGEAPGSPPFELPSVVNTVAMLAVAGGLISVLGMSVAAVVFRYRAGDVVARAQLRWFIVGAGSVPTLLVAGWIAEAFGVPVALAYTPFLVAMLVLLPATVAVGVLRRDLFDLDRVVGGALAAVLTAVVAAGVFAAVVTVVAQTGASWLGVGSAGGLAVGSFATALVLHPLHRLLRCQVGALLDPDRAVMLSEIRRFVDAVRDGESAPEQVEVVLRRCLDDPGLELLLNTPGHRGLVRLDGTAGRDVSATDPDRLIGLQWHDRTVGAVVLARVSKRRVRRAREAVIECRLAIDVSRLRLELREALDDARDSRLRLVEAAAIERRRLERDLHDGAQQQLIAIGMRLRSVQRRLHDDPDAVADIDLAVKSLEATVADLRRLAHGIRPALLDDGLATALAKLTADIPLPIEVTIGDVEVSEVVATTAYFVVAEGITNALKHAAANQITVDVRAEGDGLRIEVADDGTGTPGARPCDDAPVGRGLSSLTDRVAALGGRVTITSEPGRGTTLLAVL